MAFTREGLATSALGDFFLPSKKSKSPILYLPQHLCDPPPRDQGCDTREVSIHYAVFFHGGTHRPDRSMSRLAALRSFQRRQKIQGLGHSHCLNRQDVPSVVHNAL